MSMTMRDKNGREMKTGDVVRITGAYFKNSNGYYFIDRTPGDVSWCGRDYSLRRICKDGTISRARYNLEFWPLTSYCSNNAKNIAAREHNRDHAMIEIVDNIDKTEIIMHFETEAAREEEAASYYALHFCENSELTTEARDRAEHWHNIVKRMTEGREEA